MGLSRTSPIPAVRSAFLCGPKQELAENSTRWTRFAKSVLSRDSFLPPPLPPLFFSAGPNP